MKRLWALKERDREKEKESAREASRRYREKNREKTKKAKKEWYERNKEHALRKDKERRSKSLEAKVKYLLSSARRRAKKRGIEFDVDFLDLQVPTHCPLLGIELSYFNEGIHSPNSASLDRIDSSLGYTKNNVWIISNRANKIKNDATVPELEQITFKLKERLGRG